jgi:hypothetical protein
MFKIKEKAHSLLGKNQRRLKQEGLTRLSALMQIMFILSA